VSGLVEVDGREFVWDYRYDADDVYGDGCGHVVVSIFGPTDDRGDRDVLLSAGCETGDTVVSDHGDTIASEAGYEFYRDAAAGLVREYLSGVGLEAVGSLDELGDMFGLGEGDTEALRDEASARGLLDWEGDELGGWRYGDEAEWVALAASVVGS
jgi:hypothetical protein